MAVEIKEKPKVEEFQVVSIPEIEVSKGAERRLRKAYDRIRQPYAWTKRHYHATVGKQGIQAHCVLGAFDTTQADSKPPELVEALRLFATVAGLASPGLIPQWNDAPNRRKRHVLRVFQELLK